MKSLHILSLTHFSHPLLSISGIFTTKDDDNENQPAPRQTFTYELLNSSLPFAIHGTSLNTTGILDYEQASEWLLSIRATDSGSPPMSVVQNINIRVSGTAANQHNTPPLNQNAMQM